MEHKKKAGEKDRGSRQVGGNQAFKYCSANNHHHTIRLI